MELSHSLTLNEEALAQIPVAKRPVFIFEWLRFLDKVLVAAQKVFENIAVNFGEQEICVFRMTSRAVSRNLWSS